jgi:hypothetical protein
MTIIFIFGSLFSTTFAEGSAPLEHLSSGVAYSSANTLATSK